MTSKKIVIIGKPNVGKSTLFNLLTKSRDALVVDIPGVTRDIKYGVGRISSYSYVVMDTSGIETEKNDLDMINTTNKKVSSAVLEGDVVYFLFDSKKGITSSDEYVSKNLHKSNKKVFVVVNKSDINQDESRYLEFYSLGFGKPIAISAKTGRGVKYLLECTFPEKQDKNEKNLKNCELDKRIKIAVVGRPNVGKSTLINRILEEDRLVTSDIPGTTVDSICTDYSYLHKKYFLIDTAGLYNKKDKKLIEKFSSIKTLESIKSSQIVIVVVDISSGIKDYDLMLIGSATSIGKSVIILFNKLDAVQKDYYENFKHSVKRKLNFISYGEIHYASAKSGKGITELKKKIDQIYQTLSNKISTSQLNKVLADAVKFHEPPLVKEKRIRIRYAHIGRNYPLIVIVHGKRVELLPEQYRSYISNYFRKCLNLESIPVLLKFKNDKNPYK